MRRAALLTALAVLGAACTQGRAEAQILTQFFQAARLHDPVQLANVATVDFKPTTIGTVQDFRVIDVAESPADPRRGIVKKDVTVTTILRTPAGAAVPSTIRVTLSMASGANAEGLPIGRWFVTAVGVAGNP